MKAPAVAVARVALLGCGAPRRPRSRPRSLRLFRRRSRFGLLALAVALSACGCGSDPSDESSGSSGGTSSSAGGGSSCAALGDAILVEVTGAGSCSATVRFDYQSYRALGFQISCHPTAPPDIKQAFATAEADTKLQLAESLTEKAPKDDFVFYRAPIDFGGVAVVSARSGLTVFGAGIVWDGHGDILYPTTFRPASRLGPGCGSKKFDVAARGFDLRSKASLDAFDIGKAIDAANGTVLPEAMAQGGHLRDAMVLLYPPAVGLFDPKSAEWVVVLNSDG